MRRAPSRWWFPLFPVVVLFGGVELGLRGWGAWVRAQAGARSGASGAVVIAVGDSFTYGHGVGRDAPWPAVLPAAVAAVGGGPIQVENLGVPGSTPLGAARRLAQRLAAPGPVDVVLVQVGMNPDEEPAALAPRWDRGGVRLLLRRSALYRALVQVVARQRAAASTALQGPVDAQMQRPRPGLVETPAEAAASARRAQEALQAALLVVRDLADARGARLFAVGYAFPLSLRSSGPFTGGAAHILLRDAAGAVGVPHIDVQEVYDAQPVDGPSLVIDGATAPRPGLTSAPTGAPEVLDPRASGQTMHPNEAGHAIYADTIARALLDAGAL